MMRRSSDK